MKFDFDTLVDRSNIGNMKYLTTLDIINRKGTISYAGAEMDFKTAPVIIDAIIRRAKNGLLGFTLADKNYLNSIKWWMETQRNWEVDYKWIVPTYGTIHSVATAIRAFTNEGNGIIVQSPIYNRYDQAAKRTKRKTVFNPLIYKDGKYHMDFDNLEKCMKCENNKLMIICNPHNPIGRVWDRKDLANVAYFAKKYNVIVFSDEIFAEVVFDGHITTPYSTVEHAKNNCIVATSLGKTFNLTGVNNANIIILNDKIREAFIIQRDSDHYGSIDPIAYASICAAYSEVGADWVSEMKKYVWENIILIQNFFKENIPKVNIVNTEGTFMIWIDWNNLELSEEELYSFLINEAYLELDRGSHYGDDGVGFSRMNVASPRKEIVKSLDFFSMLLLNVDIL